MRKLLHFNKFYINSRRIATILGIETSCDDTAVCVINDKREVLSALTFTDRDSQVQKGGICPDIVAKQHREHLPRLIDKCIADSGVSIRDLTAIAVTTTPGLVIALKEGIKSAIQLSQIYEKTLIPVHHMRAHALAAFLVSSELNFPFISVLISGGHALFVLVESVDSFKLLGKSLSGSPGECIDKVARELNISGIPEFRRIHPGAAVEILASKSTADGHLRYNVTGPSVSGANMDFSQLKSNALGAITKAKNSDDLSLEDACATVQYQVARHICTRFNAALDSLKISKRLTNSIKHVVIGGGVASNKYIQNAISKVSNAYGLSTILIPQRLCTDNAEMIALTGLLKLEARSNDLYYWPDIPDTIYAHARSDVGEDKTEWIMKKPEQILGGPSIHGDKPLYLYSKEDFRKEICKVSV